eukprot:Skav226673  [mRNA]  locus=scaffold861:319722:322902:+ [translate_table: standard]
MHLAGVNHCNALRIPMGCSLVTGAYAMQLSQSPASPQRHFPRKVYWLCSLVDLVARSTWVFTLMPTSVVTGNIVLRVILVSVMSSVEIMRRSMWAVLRGIEYEQLTNASRWQLMECWKPAAE